MRGPTPNNTLARIVTLQCGYITFVIILYSESDKILLFACQLVVCGPNGTWLLPRPRPLPRGPRPSLAPSAPRCRMTRRCRSCSFFERISFEVFWYHEPRERGHIVISHHRGLLRLLVGYWVRVWMVGGDLIRSFILFCGHVRAERSNRRTGITAVKVGEVRPFRGRYERTAAWRSCTWRTTRTVAWTWQC